MMLFKGKKNIFFQRRQSVLVVFFVLIAFVIISRLFYLQILRGDYYAIKASDQHKIEQVLLQKRGEVFIHDALDKDLSPLIINKHLNIVYTVPIEVVNPQATAEKLANIFEDPSGECQDLLAVGAPQLLIDKCQLRKKIEDEIYSKITKKNDPYEPIRNKVAMVTVNLIKAANLKGIYFDDEWIRYYSEKEQAAQVSGFWGYHNGQRVGQYGIEGYFDKELTGTAGSITGDKDSVGRIISVGKTKLVQAQDGADIVLTLDRTIQDKAYGIIKQAVDDYAAEYGTIIVMNPKNGKILAMVGAPSFDPNNYSEVTDMDVYKNYNISEPYEPGSIFKVITMAIGLDSKAVQVDDEYYDEGFVKFGKYILRNADNKKFGKVNMIQVLENSINSGAIYVALKTGKDNYNNYLKRFGFTSQTNIGSVGQTLGNFDLLKKPGDIYLATASFGQGITVTPLQMATAMATIVNHGRLIQPKLVEKIGEYILPMATDELQVITPKTADILKAMLVSVIKNGHGKLAGVPGYYLGGKTGTAQIASKGGYSDNNTNHSFIGFGPLDNSKFVIMVKLSKPKNGRFSATTAAPIFSKMASFLLQYFKIPPKASS